MMATPRSIATPPHPQTPSRRQLAHGTSAARARRHLARPRARGLSLVELLIGLGIGLAITAAALSLLAIALRGQQQVVLETRLAHELRSAHDVVARSLRRAGHWAEAATSVAPPSDTPGRVNPLSPIDSTEQGHAIVVRYSRDDAPSTAALVEERVGFRLRDGVVQALIGAGRWQAMTDPGTGWVTRLQGVPSVRETSLAATCLADCPAESSTCPPRVLVRSAAIEITGRSVADPAVSRTLQSTVGIRNHEIVGACASMAAP